MRTAETATGTRVYVAVAANSQNSRILDCIHIPEIVAVLSFLQFVHAHYLYIGLVGLQAF